MPRAGAGLVHEDDRGSDLSGSEAEDGGWGSDQGELDDFFGGRYLDEEEGDDERPNEDCTDDIDGEAEEVEPPCLPWDRLPVTTLRSLMKPRRRAPAPTWLALHFVSKALIII